MIIKTEQPQTDVEALVKLIDSGQDIGASPHVGNLNQATNPHYLALGMLGVRIEMVNTVTVQDKHGRPTVKIVGDQEKSLVCLSNQESNKFLPCGVRLENGETLESLHINAVLANGLQAQTTTGFIAEIGTKMGLKKGETLQALALAYDGMMRLAVNGQVSSNPAKRLPNTAIASWGLFGDGQQVNTGLIVPVQAMSAAEVVKAVLNGQDTAVHIGGSDMVEYAITPEFAQTTAAIANKALATLGLQSPKSLRYIILDKNEGIAGLAELSAQLSKDLGLTNFSQHDTIGSKSKARRPQ